MKTEELLKLAIVTGGKSFDVPGFHNLFRGMTSIVPYIQHIDDYASSGREIRETYDGVLFFIFMREPPSDRGIPAYCGTPETALREILEIRQGIILMHHSCLSFPGWDFWDDLCGLHPRRLDSYSHDESVPVRVCFPPHPATEGLTDWTMTDEIYKMAEPSPDCTVVLECGHPQSMKALAWTAHRGRNRLFNTLSGHDGQCWRNPCFVRLLEQGIRWACDK